MLPFARSQARMLRSSQGTSFYQTTAGLEVRSLPRHPHGLDGVADYIAALYWSPPSPEIGIVPLGVRAPAIAHLRLHAPLFIIVL